MAMTGEDKSAIIPNEPYTPVIEKLKLSYSASDTDHVHFYHLNVFGQHKYDNAIFSSLDFVSADDQKKRLIPLFRNEGACYIGLKDLQATESISLLFQVEEGSADPDSTAQDLEWSVLCNNYWKVLDDRDILSDSTNQLLRSGIIRLTIPKEATTDNSLMDKGLLWLRITIPESVNAVCQMIQLHTQAVAATFEDNENDLAHLATGLPAGTITKMVERQAGIKKVTQPYGSFGGSPVEEQSDYYTRVSERLRHKQRAVTIWDHEHLVLQEFPTIYKVKCVNHTCRTSELAPGHVSIVVIPDISNSNTSNRLKPKVSLDLQEEIREFLTRKSTFFLDESVHVSNPDYEELYLDFEVQFHQEYEFGYYQAVLEEDIISYLSPWASDPTAEISFGGEIHKSDLIKFIEDREYVDYVAEFKLYHTDGSGTKKEVDEAVASNAKAILVSADGHLIKQISGSCNE
jgi:hypothetical protein